MNLPVVAYEILPLNRFSANGTDVDFRQWLVPPRRETAHRRHSVDARLYAFLESLMRSYLFLQARCPEPNRLTSSILEYLGKSHGIVVLLLMSERGRYHKG